MRIMQSEPVTLEKLYFFMQNYAKENRAFQNETMNRFAKIDERFEQIDNRFAKIENRLDQIENRLNQVEDRLDQVENRLAIIESTLYSLQTQISSLQNRTTRIEEKMNEMWESRGSLKVSVTRASAAKNSLLAGTVAFLVSFFTTKYST